MGSYSNYIKKIGIAYALKSNLETEILPSTFIDKKVIVKKKVKNKLIPDLSESEKEEIKNADDWHEFIDPPIISDQEEE